MAVRHDALSASHPLSSQGEGARGEDTPPPAPNDRVHWRCFVTGQAQPGSAARGGLFYGWYIVAALFFATFLVVGTRQSFGIYVKTWEEVWQVSVGTISIAASVGWLLNGLSQPILGRLTDRIGGRPVVI